MLYYLLNMTLYSKADGIFDMGFKMQTVTTTISSTSLALQDFRRGKN